MSRNGSESLHIFINLGSPLDKSSYTDAFMNAAQPVPTKTAVTFGTAATIVAMDPSRRAAVVKVRWTILIKMSLGGLDQSGKVAK